MFGKIIYRYVLISFFLLNWVLVSSGSGEETNTLVTDPPQAGSVSKIMFLTHQPPLDLQNFYLQTEAEDAPLWQDEFQKPSGRKSATKAMVLSLILPGAGEYYAESKLRSGVFLGIEGAIWSSFLGFRTYGSWKKRDYKGYASLHADANLEGKSDDFFEDLTYYDNRDEYNQFARLYDGDAAIIYPENDFWNWQWDSQSSRERYRELRNQSKSAYRKALYMVGLAALNRVVSVLDAAYSVRKFNRKLGSEFSSVSQRGMKFRLDANPFGNNPHFILNLSKKF
jgi:hypothetical protein